MKFIINESKLKKLANKYVFEKLNSLKLSPEEDDDGGFRVDFDKTSQIEPGLGAFHYVDGTLEVSPSILIICDMFSGLEGVGDYEIVGKWFEINYGFEVDNVWPWVDYSP